MSDDNRPDRFSDGSSTARDAMQIALTARQDARQALSNIQSHEDLCAERYENIHASISEIKSFLRWAGVTGFGIIISLLGFLALQLFNANQATTQAVQAKVELLEQQRADQRQPRERTKPAVSQTE